MENKFIHLTTVNGNQFWLAIRHIITIGPIPGFDHSVGARLLVACGSGEAYFDVKEPVAAIVGSVEQVALIAVGNA